MGLPGLAGEQGRLGPVMASVSRLPSPRSRREGSRGVLVDQAVAMQEPMGFEPGPVEGLNCQ